MVPKSASACLEGRQRELWIVKAQSRLCTPLRQHGSQFYTSNPYVPHTHTHTCTLSLSLYIYIYIYVYKHVNIHKPMTSHATPSESYEGRRQTALQGLGQAFGGKAGPGHVSCKVLFALHSEHAGSIRRVYIRDTSRPFQAVVWAKSNVLMGRQAVRYSFV